MKLNLLFTSFRFKIILTLILVIASVSFLSLFFFNHTLSKKIYSNAETDIISFLYFFRDQIIFIHDGRTIPPSLEKLTKSESVERAYLFNARGSQVYPLDTISSFNDASYFKLLTDQENDVSLNTLQEGAKHYFRAAIRFSNSPSCYGCHSPGEKVLGFVVLDFSMHQYENTVNYTRKFSMVFTIIMICLIIIFVLIMHYRFIKKSLSDFKSTINLINKGNLEGRVKIPDSKELGELGKSFNTMVEHLQKTQEELFRYHQKELNNQQKLATIGEMSARLAHEIRNPITGIANAVEIIINETQDQENKSVLEEIRRQANRVNKAISNLLNYSRTKELNLQEGNINEIIKSVVFFLQNQVSDKTILIEVEIDEFIPQFIFDAEKIENVLLNLGMNAYQSIDYEGIINITSAFDSSAGKVRISFKDTGKGIPEDKINEIFNPFFTLRTEGTGLGLAIVKEIIELHEGKISVVNNPGRGCTFHISLPCEQLSKSLLT